MKMTVKHILLVSSCLFSIQSQALDAVSWLFAATLGAATNQVDSWNAGPAIGPINSPNEGELNKQLSSNLIVGTPEQIKLLSEGPVYITRNGLKSVGIDRPYRMKKDGVASDFIITFTDNMSENYKQFVAHTAIKYRGVLVLRGLLNDSVEDTIQSMKPYVEMGALVMIDPSIEEKFGKKFVAKSPVIVNALYDESAGEYGCKSDTEKKCTKFTSVSGFARTFSDGLRLDLTIDHLSLGPTVSQWNSSNKAFEEMFEERFKDVLDAMKAKRR